MKTKPIIGVTLDFETGGKPGNFSKMPHYAVRKNYLTAVSELGAVAMPLPHDVAAVESYLSMIDGLIITGGGFDVPPEYYGEAVASDKVTTKNERTQFEFAITRGAIERNIPVLGICGGEQLLNVVLGGTLIQHIPDSIPNALEHEQKNARTEPGHEITISSGTLLHKITGVASAAVNTAHHQAVAKPAPGVVINSRSNDGVIEGIELPSHPFCLGVQWHPEYFVSPIDKKIFEAFVDACRVKPKKHKYMKRAISLLTVFLTIAAMIVWARATSIQSTQGGHGDEELILALILTFSSLIPGIIRIILGKYSANKAVLITVFFILLQIPFVTVGSGLLLQLAHPLFCQWPSNSPALCKTCSEFDPRYGQPDFHPCGG